MLWRVVVVLVGVGFVAYRMSLWWEIRRATRSGDAERVERLRRRGFGLYRWAAAVVLLVVVALTLLVWSNSR